MNQIINLEIKFFLVSILSGVVLLIIYDVLRIFRKVVEHGVVWISLEDIVYWVICSVLIFRMMYKMNDGVIRGFSLLGILLGMILYKVSISDYIVKGISFVLIKIKNLIEKIIGFLLKPFKFVLNKIMQFLKFIGRKLMRPLEKLMCFTRNKLRVVYHKLQRSVKRGRIKNNDYNDGQHNEKNNDKHNDERIIGSTATVRVKKIS